MQSYKQNQPKQQEILLVNETRKEVPAKRVNIVSLKMVRDSTIHYQDRHIRSPQDSYNIIRTFLEDADREMFVVMALDVKNQPTNIQIAHIGSLNASIVHPREIMKMAILSNAASLIVFHNHPSGHVSPSSEDFDVTKRLKEAGEIMGIELLDHLIISSENTFYSFKEKGHL